MLSRIAHSARLLPALSRTLATSAANQATVTVCGGGNASHIAAGMFGQRGDEVRLFFSFADEAAKFRVGCEKNGGVTVTSKTEQYTGQPSIISAEAAEVIPGSDVIIIITPAFAHENILQVIAPHLDNGACVGAIPGPGGFDLIARGSIGDTLKAKDITLFGASSLPWACRFEEYGARASLLGEKEKVPVTAFPDTPEAATKLEPILNSIHRNTKFTVGGHFLNTTLWCTNAIIHPGITYGIWHDWDGKPVAEKPLFYQNCNKFTANVLDSLSNEIAASVKVLSAETNADMSKWQPIDVYMRDTYGHSIADQTSTDTIMATNDAFRGLTAPVLEVDGGYLPNYDTRYLTEDLPHGLAVLRGIAEICGVETPMMDTVLTWTQEKIGHEYLVDGKIQGKDVAHSGCPQRWGITTVQDLVAH
eukprot:m.85048 g.85048  ORF g.85048 m.85048 type:complete len:419 (+) comp12772_c0_seq1:297-1553(+)